MSTYRRHISNGYRSLRFEQPLETDFRNFFVQSSAPHLRIAMFVSALIALSVPIFDFFANGPGFSHPVVPVRATFTLLLTAALFVTTFTKVSSGIHQAIALPLGLSIGLGSLIVNNLAFSDRATDPTAGYVLMTFFIYFFLGLRFRPAVTVALILLVTLLAGPSLFGFTVIDGPALVSVCLANVIAASGLYNLEYTLRGSYLREHELEQISRQDSLTGLANRIAFDEQVKTAWAACRRDGKPISIALIDIDHFKAFNDTYGHQEGDQCLIEIAGQILSVVRRPLDMAARYGGEEFIVVLADSQISDATDVLEKLCQQISDLNIPHSASPTAPHVTISVGVAATEPATTARSVAGLIQAADEALYKAKQHGRDQVVVAKPDESGGPVTGWFQAPTKRPQLA